MGSVWKAAAVVLVRGKQALLVAFNGRNGRLEYDDDEGFKALKEAVDDVGNIRLSRTLEALISLVCAL